MALKTISYKNIDFPISYEILDHSAPATLVILHGWGSNKEVMQQAFKDSFKDFNHCYIDLPGFGKSPNQTPLHTTDYAQILRIFLNLCNLTPKVVMGHSFGGKIAVLLGYETILLSSAGILESKPLGVRLKILLAKMFKRLRIKSRFLLSKDASNLNAGMYQTFKNVVNEDFSKIFSEFRQKTTIFWGREDRATRLESGQKISKLMRNSRFFCLEGDHFFFLKQALEIDRLYHKDGE